MKVDSLEELESAFAEWRKGKRHVREPMPEELHARAQRAAKKHGVKAVVRVTGVDRGRLLRTRAGRAKTALVPKAASAPGAKPTADKESVPAFSHVTLSAPSSPSPRPLAEVETSGVTLRVFEASPEMLGLLRAACGAGAMS